MIQNFANSVLTASSWTRILAFVSNASSISAAIRIQNAFWSTTWIRITLIFRQAHACVTVSAFGVRSATTRIAFNYYGSHSCKFYKIRMKYSRIIGNCNIFLRFGTRRQIVNGSPVYPSIQVQTGTWLITWQLAPVPQDPGQGSRHLSLMHAKLLEHSWWMTHSGLQFGGLPK